MAVGTGGEIQTSPDGITWTSRTPAASFSGTWYAVSYDTSSFIAVGAGGEVQASSDGITWYQVAAAFSTDLHAIAHDADELFCAVGASGQIQTATKLEPDDAYE